MNDRNTNVAATISHAGTVTATMFGDPLTAAIYMVGMLTGLEALAHCASVHDPNAGKIARAAKAAREAFDTVMSAQVEVVPAGKVVLP